ncbi:hypothetical protein FHX42_000060 [Saccharopolyspora lacisalsi]|uniref:Bacteriocin fulvocin C-related protein n=1 Tax=Halosaccharopolyspora lacisalsi TaxID=1000566 RepID=A0A839DUB4_9PSEU|nr:bacteriocin fulvocin C-related protein [Halosaccharopolyspora lacisalsi]MBA8822731.1 hypothetical protein [Halosaccharopolyspora lacisalsi]
MTHSEVRQWRERVLGDRARWEPTLLRVRDESVRVWTGASMGLPLVRRLGARSTAQVLRSLGQLRRQVNGYPLEPASIGRARFLRLAGGAAVAAGIVFTGRTPAFAERGCAAARDWVEANKGRLPTTYDEITAYPMVYRRAIYSELSPVSKSGIWIEHLDRYRAAHPDLSTEQVKVVDAAKAIAANPTHFESGNRPDRALAQLKESAVGSFGKAGAGALLATIGPPEYRSASGAPACECTNEDEYCPDRHYCQYKSSNCSFNDGCGTFGLYVCNGLCDYGG